MAGPKRPQDRIDLPDVKKNFLTGLGAEPKTIEMGTNGERTTLRDGSVVIAAITSCTNTSNPSVMVAAGLLAKKAVERGLKSKPWVKTSLAPGSKVVMDYLGDAGLIPYLEKLQFNLVGYGCTTCIGNSGPLPDEVADAVQSGKLTVAAVLSGNRNFEGRINSLVRANYLASPPLVVAYALAGRVDVDLTHDPIGQDESGHDVFLREIWPSPAEVQAVVKKSVQREMFAKQYSEVFEGDAQWNSIRVPAGDLYEWSDKSTYVKRAPYFDHMADPATHVRDMQGLRVLAMLGDSVTTDHISPAGNIAVDGPAGQYLISLGVKPVDFNSYGSRRGNHEVMVRGTLANIRLRNQIAPGTEGGWTTHMPSGRRMFIYDASVEYQKEGVPLLIIAGKEYGAGSSRDWAAKGVLLLGVRGDRGKFRAHPSLEPGGHGSPAAAVRRQPESRIAGIDRVRELRDGGNRGGCRFVRHHACERDRHARRNVEILPRTCAHRYATGSRVLSQRRHPAVCAAPNREVKNGLPQHAAFRRLRRSQ